MSASNGSPLSHSQAKCDLVLMTTMTRLHKYQVLVIDDIDYVKKTDAETQVLFEFIAHRYESGSLIITSNKPFSQWDHIFPDTMMTFAGIDRIIHHATIIEIQEESYRKKTEPKKVTVKPVRIVVVKPAKIIDAEHVTK